EAGVPLLEEGVWAGTPVEGIDLEPPVLIGSEVEVGLGARIVGPAVVGRGSSIGAGAYVGRGAVLLQGAAVAPGAVVAGGISGPMARGRGLSAEGLGATLVRAAGRIGPPCSGCAPSSPRSSRLGAPRAEASAPPAETFCARPVSGASPRR